MNLQFSRDSGLLNHNGNPLQDFHERRKSAQRRMQAAGRAFKEKREYVQQEETETSVEAKFKADMQREVSRIAERQRKIAFRDSWRQMVLLAAKEQRDNQSLIDLGVVNTSITQIIGEVIAWFNTQSGFTVTKNEIVSVRRERRLVLPRQCICYRARMETSFSLPAIGRRLGNRDHTTILHSCRKFEEHLEAARRGEISTPHYPPETILGAVAHLEDLR